MAFDDNDVVSPIGLPKCIDGAELKGMYIRQHLLCASTT